MSLSSKLPGTWLLLSRIDVTKDGKRHPDPMLGEDPVALLIYDGTGHFSAQFMKRDRSTVDRRDPRILAVAGRLLAGVNGRRVPAQKPAVERPRGPMHGAGDVRPDRDPPRLASPAHDG